MSYPRRFLCENNSTGAQQISCASQFDLLCQQQLTFGLGNVPHTVEAFLTNTLVSGQLFYLRMPSQDPVFLNSDTNSIFLHSPKRPAPLKGTFYVSWACPLTRASTVYSLHQSYIPLKPSSTALPVSPDVATRIRNLTGSWDVDLLEIPSLKKCGVNCKARSLKDAVGPWNSSCT